MLSGCPKTTSHFAPLAPKLQLGNRCPVLMRLEADWLPSWSLGTRESIPGQPLSTVKAAKRMVQRGSGTIVNITSINAVTTGPGSGGYPAAKAGLHKLTELMALEWGPSGLRVNAVAPGFIDAGISTPFYADPEVRALRGGAVPSRRLGLASDIADAVSFLVGDRASYINGHQLVVDGGVSVSLLTQLPRVKPPQ